MTNPNPNLAAVLNDFTTWGTGWRDKAKAEKARADTLQAALEDAVVKADQAAADLKAFQDDDAATDAQQLADQAQELADQARGALEAARAADEEAPEAPEETPPTTGSPLDDVTAPPVDTSVTPIDIDGNPVNQLPEDQAPAEDTEDTGTDGETEVVVANPDAEPVLAGDLDPTTKVVEESAVDGTTVAPDAEVSEAGDKAPDTLVVEVNEVPAQRQ